MWAGARPGVHLVVYPTYRSIDCSRYRSRHPELRPRAPPKARRSRVSSRFSAVPEPFLDPNGQKLGFRRPKTPNRSPPTAHTLAPTSHSPDYSAPMGGGNVGANVCAVGGDLLGVSGPQKPKQSSIWVEKRTAQKRPEKRPSFGQAHGKSFF